MEGLRQIIRHVRYEGKDARPIGHSDCMCNTMLLTQTNFAVLYEYTVVRIVYSDFICSYKTLYMSIYYRVFFMTG